MKMLARQDATGGSGLLERILNTPGLEHVVPRLHPDLLHRLIQTCGLEDCSEIVALATPQQLQQVFDLDLWRAARAGEDEGFDASRFGVWIEVLLESGATGAAHKLAQIDVDVVIAGLAQHALVRDRGAVSIYETTDGELVEPHRALDDGLVADVGGYQLVARCDDSWDAIVEVLMSLEAERPDYFHRAMQGCRRLSSSGYEIDGLVDLLTERDQDMFDLSVDREERREKQGFVMPAQARAFLQMSRELQPGCDARANPISRAYFQAIDRAAMENAEDASSSTSFLTAAAEASVFEALLDAGVLAQPPRALISGSDSTLSTLEHVRTRLEFARDNDHAAYLARTEELAYLANTLVAGCSIQGRPFMTQEASDAAIAICNLGLENLRAVPLSFLVDHDLVSVFHVGWSVLHNDVGLYAAEQVIACLEGLRCDDREIQAGLDALRIKLAKHWKAGSPWRARDALDVIAILDTLVWTILLALIQECPVLHTGVAAMQDPRTHSVSASDFEFISENSQIASVREFLRSLPKTLGHIGSRI